MSYINIPMPRYCLLLFVFIHILVSAGPVTQEITGRMPIPAFGKSSFPDSSLLNRSSLLETPAGKHGFVTTRGGHFVFTDGRRVRFFGVNLAKESVFIAKDQIVKLADLFARTGINLVRIHHIDDTVGGILSTDGTAQFNAERIDLIDYWIATLKARGIYVCLDLNDYRTFRAAEGVVKGEELGRGAKPYAVFDTTLINLQQQYARMFLVDHKNPYTELSYANDPAVAMLEIYDENGLFIRRNDISNLKEPYSTALKNMWNNWLKEKYRTDIMLQNSWVDKNGVSALLAGESLVSMNIALPKMDINTSLTPLNNPLLMPVRQSDGVMFLSYIQQEYFKSMESALRLMGVRIPITAVGAQEIMPDLEATAKTLDYIGINYYWDHPGWDSGKDWVMPGYISLNNPLITSPQYSFPAVISEARVNGKPLVVREWGYCYPNPYRGTGMIEAAAYGAFLDIDALILFTYGALEQMKSITFFDVHNDPLRWGQVGTAARIFMSNEISPAKNSIGIGFSDVDLNTWFSYDTPLYQLSFFTRVDNYFWPDAPHPYDLLITSGRSVGTLWNSNRLLLMSNNNHTDLTFQNSATGADAMNGYNLSSGRSGQFGFVFNGIGADTGVTSTYQAWPAFSTAELLRKSLSPIGVNGGSSLGFIDNVRQNAGFRTLREDLAMKVALDMLHKWNDAPFSHRTIESGVYRNDTSEIIRDTNNGRLFVDTPNIQIITGQLSGMSLRTSNVILRTDTPIGTLSVESLDKEKIQSSKSLRIAMSTRAVNSGVSVSKVTGKNRPYRLNAFGTAPITTDGMMGTTHVEIAGNTILDIALKNGTWEYITEPDTSLLTVDTPGTTVILPHIPRVIRYHFTNGHTDIIPTTPNFVTPDGATLIEIGW
ncbi:MAG: hypothetical protein WCO98_01550 [bacterium]